MQTVNILVVVQDRASTNLRQIGSNADTSRNKLQLMGKVGRAAMKGLAAGALLGAAALGFAGKAAADDEASHKQMAIQIRNATDARSKDIRKIEDWILKTSLATGVADDELRPAYTRLVTATHDVAKAQDLLTLAQDVSAGTGRDLMSVADALVKAQNGSVQGLTRMGVATKDAEGKTKSFNEIQKDLARTFDGAAVKSANSATGQYNRLKVMFQETAESIGYKLLPYAIRLATWIENKGIPAAQKLGTWLKDHLGPAISDVVEWFKKGSQKGGDVSSVMDDMSGFVDDAKRSWKALSPFLKEAAQDFFPMLVTQIKTSARVLRLMGDAFIALWNNAWAPMMKLMLRSWSVFLGQIGAGMKILSHAPGMGWMKKAGDNLLDAAGKADHLADSIRDIPTRKDVKINVVTHYSQMGRPPANSGVQTGPDGIPLTRTSGSGRGAVGGLMQGAVSVLVGLLPGIDKAKKAGTKVLDLVKSDLQEKKDKLREILDASADFAASFKGWAKSIFSMQSSEDAPLSLQGILDAQHSEESKSASVLSDVQKVLSMGLSQDLVEQLQANGEQGAETLHLLAQADAATIAEFNRSNEQTMKNYGAAGMQAADKVYAASIAQAEANVALSQSLADVIAGIKNLEKVDFIVRGNDLVAVLKKNDKDKGK